MLKFRIDRFISATYGFSKCSLHVMDIEKRTGFSPFFYLVIFIGPWAEACCCILCLNIVNSLFALEIKHDSSLIQRYPGSLSRLKDN